MDTREKRYEAALTEVEAEVIQERDRQVRKGWDSYHDDQHVDSSIGRAGGLLASVTAIGSRAEQAIDPEFDGGTWVAKFVRRCVGKYIESKRRRYIIAAALLIAEVERIDRAEAKRAARVVKRAAQ